MIRLRVRIVVAGRSSNYRCARNSLVRISGKSGFAIRNEGQPRPPKMMLAVDGDFEPKVFVGCVQPWPNVIDAARAIALGFHCRLVANEAVSWPHSDARRQHGCPVSSLVSG